MSFKKEHRQESFTYLALWTMLFMAPILSLSIRSSLTNEMFEWREILIIWRQYIPYLVIFLVHNHLMAPTLVYEQKKTLYFSQIAFIAVIFLVYQCNHRPRFDKEAPRAEMMTYGERPPAPPDFRGEPRMHDRGQEESGRHGHAPDHLKHHDGALPPLMIGQHNVVSLIILILMLGMNVGVKLYFKQRSDQKQLAELEKQNLERQLEYLKYQINPHFLMNTLNNIHALVDIDPEKAKTTILELSKIMRFVLYEGNKQGVPLDREIAFLKNYITLMKLRYTDKVSITVKTPDSLPNKEVPPLMFITFVENAFKHGVSYRQESFIDISIEIKDALVFCCKNSRIPNAEDKHGGVGLANVKKRLELIYGRNFTLDIKDKPDIYSVELIIPL